MTADLAIETFPRLLSRVDRILRRAVDNMLASSGPDTALDPFRGLYISPHDAARLFDPWPGTSSDGFDLPIEPLPADASDELATLADEYHLSSFDVDVILLALAPELDLRYERVYAFLQDDVSRRRPSIDLALNLLCATPEQKLLRRQHFTPDGRLVAQDLISLVPESTSSEPPLLAHALKLDERVVRRLLRETSLDPLLRSACELVQPTDAFDDPSVSDQLDALAALARRARSAGEPLRLYLSGRRGWTKLQVARALAASRGVPMVAADLTRALSADGGFEVFVRRMLDEVRRLGAILYAEPWDAVQAPDRLVERQVLMDALAEHDGITILAGTQPRPPRGRGTRGQLHVDLPVPSHERRSLCWRAGLGAAGEAIDEHALDQLAGRFRLAPDQIVDAVASARSQVRWRSATAAPHDPGPDATLRLEDLFRAARAQSDAALYGLARKIEPVHDWDQIVLPDDTLAQLHELCQQVVHRHRVLDEWGFGRRLSVGKGVTALFAGPSGTGKTMAADIIAHELGLDLYKIDLAGVVSKYIGETEKNLRRIFAAAEDANAILFFDEADALFGKRSEVRDSHDRYANIEIAYLLQEMDQYEGVAILATNLRQNMDEAFVRRLCFAVDFPFPDQEQRARIWRILFPPEAARESDIDFGVLSSQLRVTGGSIKNIVLGAAFLAAGADEPIGTEHLLHATRREYEKMGKVLSAGGPP